MPLKHWEKLEEKILYQNKYWTYKLDTFEIEPGDISEYHYLYTHGSTMIIPITKSKNIILVNQYRYLVDKESIEFPCGAVHEGFSIEENAVKELREEIGCSARSLIKVGEYAPYNGVSNEICHVFVAQDLYEDSLPKDKTEEFEIIEKSVSEINDMISSGIIWDGMTMAAWLVAQKYIKTLCPEI